MEALHAVTIVDAMAREHIAELTADPRPNISTSREADQPGCSATTSRPALRRRVSLALHRLADRLDSPPTGRSPLPGGAR